MGGNGCIIGCMITIDHFKTTNEMLTLIAEIEAFKGTWTSLGLLAPERLSLLRRVATIESVGSSTRIEGSQLSDRDIEKILSNLHIQKFETRDQQEVAGYAQTIELVFQSWEHIPLTENHIKQLHRDLLRYSHKDERHRGYYKTNPNHVAAFDTQGHELGIIFQTASPFDTPKLMHELIEFTNEKLELKRLHPLLVIGIFIVVFLEIHPFQDGNGRLSRILTTLLLLQNGYAYVPYSSLESLIEFNKESYYLALRKTQSSIRTKMPDWQPWLVFFLRMLHQQTKRLSEKIHQEKIFWSDLPYLSAKILEHIRSHGRVTMNDMVILTGASRHTLKEHFRLLIHKGHIVRHGQGRGVWYSLL